MARDNRKRCLHEPSPAYNLIPVGTKAESGNGDDYSVLRPRSHRTIWTIKVIFAESAKQDNNAKLHWDVQKSYNWPIGGRPVRLGAAVYGTYTRGLVSRRLFG